MEVTQMRDFTVKSRIHDYEVQFINDTKDSLKKELIKGDFIILDRKVKDLYYQELFDSLQHYKYLIIDATEEQKSYQGLIPIINLLIENGFKKNNRLVSIGGGITQDTTAFIASILYRGVSWIFYPTTLLAQGDSCIGSKTSINFGSFKNQVGGFYPPNKVLINTAFLKTLTDAEINSGLGEMCHYFVISGEDDFSMFRNNAISAKSNLEIMCNIISRSLEIKKSFIEIDEYDQNKRQIFNYGHSFGHAIESLTNYRIPHGIAVSFGMDMANFISVKMGYLNDSVRRHIRSVLILIWSDFEIEDLDTNKFLSALLKDKKNVGSELRLILAKGIGEVFKEGLVITDDFISWINQYFKEEVNKINKYDS